VTLHAVIIGLSGEGRQLEKLRHRPKTKARAGRYGKLPQEAQVQQNGKKSFEIDSGLRDKKRG